MSSLESRAVIAIGVDQQILSVLVAAIVDGDNIYHGHLLVQESVNPRIAGRTNEHVIVDIEHWTPLSYLLRSS